MDTTFISAPIALVVVGVISIMLLSFGFFAAKRLNKSSNDFLYAGRNVGLALSTATLIAAWVTGNTTMSAPEQGYTLGIIACFGYATAGLSLCIFAPLALRIKKIMQTAVPVATLYVADSVVLYGLCSSLYPHGILSDF